MSRDGNLLIATNASDVCLSCHANSNSAVLGDNPLQPPPERGGGNFVFLLEDNLNDGPDGALEPIPGNAAGHSIMAPGYGLFAEPRWDLSPGGSFQSAELSCISCHDPHGAGTFRMLFGVGPVGDGTYTFSAPAPRAEGGDPITEVESDASHSAYQGGMSEWCGNCHGLYHDRSGDSDFEHPVDEALAFDIRIRYDEYLGDEFPEGGIHDTAYLVEVPFEEPTAKTDSRRGPTGASRVFCLSCHRAHASSAPAAMRWDTNVAFLYLDGTVSGSWRIPDPFDSPIQGTLCSKCHAEPGWESDPLEDPFLLQNPGASEFGRTEWGYSERPAAGSDQR